LPEFVLREIEVLNDGFREAAMHARDKMHCNNHGMRSELLEGQCR
jgi:hypothetical protein